MLVIGGVLSAAEAGVLLAEAQNLTYEDGAKTAGRFARQVKANDQAAPSPAREAIFDKVRRALAQNPVFNSAARPRALSPLILSRYRVGQTYGLHVDDAMMGALRTDMSFTLFLAPPDSYEGGELIVEDRLDGRAVKLAAGDMILYGSGTLHRVAPVTSGARIAVVGWVQSLIRDAAQREILFDLDRAVETAHAEGGKSALFDALAKTRSNLIRMWAEN
jgi:PKHD-type hydroxylase